MFIDMVAYLLVFTMYKREKSIRLPLDRELGGAKTFPDNLLSTVSLSCDGILNFMSTYFFPKEDGPPNTRELHKF